MRLGSERPLALKLSVERKADGEKKTPRWSHCVRCVRCLLSSVTVARIHNRSLYRLMVSISDLSSFAFSRSSDRVVEDTA